MMSTLQRLCSGALVVAVAGLLAGPPPAAWAQAAAPQARPSVDSLSPVEMMEEYRARCGGTAGQAASRTGTEAALVHGQRCDALARRIQGIGLDDRREGSADLARPDFYTPGRN